MRGLTAADRSSSFRQLLSATFGLIMKPGRTNLHQGVARGFKRNNYSNAASSVQLTH